MAASDTHFTGWPDGRRAAVALTYDDGLPSHATHVAPLLEDAGLRATFYVPVSGPQFASQLGAWRGVAARGHELGNHSLFHPCRRDRPGEQPWMAEEYNLAAYTPRRWTEEMAVANLALQLLDGQTSRTFGNTCCDETIGPDRRSIHPLVRGLFPAARGPLNHAVVDPRRPDLAGLGHFSGDGGTLEERFEPIVGSALDRGGLAILMFHGVGPDEHALFTPADEHRRFVTYLGDLVARGEIWVAPLVRVAAWMTGAAASEGERR